MDSKLLVIGVLTVLLVTVVLQAYQLVGINSKLSSLQAGGFSSSSVQQAAQSASQPQQQGSSQSQQGLPAQVGGC